MTALKDKIVFITGATAGIGRACAESFAREGAHVIASGRREDRLNALAGSLQKEFHIRAVPVVLDVRDRSAVFANVKNLPDDWRKIDILINNAGLGRGLDKLHEGNPDDWEEMIDTNVKGLLYVTRAIIPGMLERRSGHIINIGSIAGHEAYPKGNVYNATKFAVDGITKALRMDLVDTPLRVSTIDPGLVETEFSLVRFHGDEQRAKNVYENIEACTPEDVAEAALFCATRPPHVSINQVVIMPTAQASPHVIHRGPLA